MTTKTFDVQEHEPSWQELLALVQEGTEVLLTAGDKPLARVTPIEAPRGKRIAGLHQGSIWTSDDFDEPLPDEFWLGEDA